MVLHVQSHNADDALPIQQSKHFRVGHDAASCGRLWQIDGLGRLIPSALH